MGINLCQSCNNSRPRQGALDGDRPGSMARKADLNERRPGSSSRATGNLKPQRSAGSNEPWVRLGRSKDSPIRAPEPRMFPSNPRTLGGGTQHPADPISLSLVIRPLFGLIRLRWFAETVVSTAFAFTSDSVTFPTASALSSCSVARPRPASRSDEMWGPLHTNRHRVVAQHHSHAQRTGPAMPDPHDQCHGLATSVVLRLSTI